MASSLRSNVSVVNEIALLEYSSPTTDDNLPERLLENMIHTGIVDKVVASGKQFANDLHTSKNDSFYENHQSDQGWIRLTVEDLFRVIRHMNSAHADPMDNPKLKEKYNQLFAAEAFDLGNDNDLAQTKFMVSIAGHLVSRLKVVMEAAGE